MIEAGRDRIKLSNLSAVRPVRLFTAFGTVVYVDSASGELRHGPLETSPGNAGFVADASQAGPHHQGWLMHDTGRGHELIACASDCCQTVSQAGERPAAPTMLELIPLERGLIAFRAKELFLSAAPEGTIRLSAPTCNTFELFLPSEHWCTVPAATGGTQSSAPPAAAKLIDKNIRRYIVHPLERAKANVQTQKPKVVIFGYTRWSHGRVYYDLCKHLSRRGYIVDILDWQGRHSRYIGDIVGYYDFFVSALDGIWGLIKFGVPRQKIIAVSHSEWDIRILIEKRGIDIFEEFANYAVASEFLYCASLVQGVRRIPKVTTVGVEYSEFYADIAQCLATVGYASSMSAKPYGVELKRGTLASAAAREAGLGFKVAGSTGYQTSFHDMPEFYKSVDAVLMTSITESGPLPVMEAAAAGRLVIGTPVGNFPVKAYAGAGILAPVEAEKFKAFTVATLKYYKDNPGAYVDKCHSIQEAARAFDWQYYIDEWVELIESAQPVSSG
jgi:hypothetical protein